MLQKQNQNSSAAINTQWMLSVAKWEFQCLLCALREGHAGWWVLQLDPVATKVKLWSAQGHNAEMEEVNYFICRNKLLDNLCLAVSI